MIIQGGRLFEGGYYFKYFHQRGGGLLFEGGGLIKGRLLPYYRMLTLVLIKVFEINAN